MNLCKISPLPTKAITNSLIMCVLSASLHLLYLFKTDYRERTYDADSHLKHIEYVRTTLSIPKSADCFECYHPPLYYTVAAAIAEGSRRARLLSPEKALQLLSVAIFFVFLGSCVITSRVISFDASSFLTTVAFVLFWPSTFIHSSRIGNDVLFYCLHGLCFMFLVKWILLERVKYAYYACVVAVCALLTKANGGITMLLAFLATLPGTLAYRSSSRRPGLMSLKCGCILLAGGLLFLLITSLKGAAFTNVNKLGPELIVRNGLSNFFYFDVKTFFSMPFINSMQDVTGRQYFWNFLLKTSLFGEFDLSNWLSKDLAIILSALLLLIIIICSVGVFCAPSGPIHRIFLLNGMLLITGSILYRWAFPFSCSGDFRYILPIILPGAVYYSEAMRVLSYSKLPILRDVGLGAIAAFAVTSILFICSVVLAS